jgi:LuxR family maltose regulon positive regulatory protein
MRTAEAALRLTRADPQTAREVLAGRARLDDARPGAHPVWEVAALVLEAITCDALDLPDDADQALEKALGLAAPDHVLFPLLLHPAPSLLKRHIALGSAHAALIQEILVRISANDDATPAARQLETSTHLRDPLSGSEMRVLRYLPTNLSAPEIAAELSLSVNTVRTHMRHVYEKLGAHGRSEAVELARAHGLIAPATNYA